MKKILLLIILCAFLIPSFAIAKQLEGQVVNFITPKQALHTIKRSIILTKYDTKKYSTINYDHEKHMYEMGNRKPQSADAYFVYDSDDYGFRYARELKEKNIKTCYSASGTLYNVCTLNRKKYPRIEHCYTHPTGDLSSTKYYMDPLNYYVFYKNKLNSKCLKGICKTPIINTPFFKALYLKKSWYFDYIY